MKYTKPITPPKAQLDGPANEPANEPVNGPANGPANGRRAGQGCLTENAAGSGPDAASTNGLHTCESSTSDPSKQDSSELDPSKLDSSKLDPSKLDPWAPALEKLPANLTCAAIIDVAHVEHEITDAMVATACAEMDAQQQFPFAARAR